MFATDTAGIILSVNRAAVQTFGYNSPNQLIGQNISIIVGGGHAAQHDGYMQHFLKTREKHLMGSQRQVQARRADGTEFPVILGIEFVEHDDDADPIFVAFVRDHTVEQQNQFLEIEKRTAENLLLNMLPREIAHRLRCDPDQNIADHHQTATILFADVVGFTKMSSTMAPLQVVNLLNDLFCRFDNLVDFHGLNKIKTIGD